MPASERPRRLGCDSNNKKRKRFIAQLKVERALELNLIKYDTVAIDIWNLNSALVKKTPSASSEKTVFIAVALTTTSKQETAVASIIFTWAHMVLKISCSLVLSKPIWSWAIRMAPQVPWSLSQPSLLWPVIRDWIDTLEVSHYRCLNTTETSPARSKRHSWARVSMKILTSRLLCTNVILLWSKSSKTESFLQLMWWKRKPIRMKRSTAKSKS